MILIVGSVNGLFYGWLPIHVGASLDYSQALPPQTYPQSMLAFTPGQPQASGAPAQASYYGYWSMAQQMQSKFVKPVTSIFVFPLLLTFVIGAFVRWLWY